MADQPVYMRLLGTITDLFQVGDGPVLADNTGDLDVKDDVGTYEVVRAADPVDDDSLVTRRWHSLNSSPCTPNIIAVDTMVPDACTMLAGNLEIIDGFELLIGIDSEVQVL